MPRMPARVQKPTEINRSDQLSTYTRENQENNGSELVTVLTIFQECEDSHDSHDRLISQLKIEFYDKLNIDEFCEDFLSCCRSILSIEDRLRSETPSTFVVRFVVYCVTKCENNNELKEKSLTLLRRLIKFFVSHFDVQQPFVRFNAVKAVRILLNELTDDIEIPDKLFGQTQSALLKRFWDVKSFIRSEAAIAASRLQSPMNLNCPIVVSLINLCKFDSSHIVRLAAMEALAITTKTLPVIIAQCRDVNDLVRKKTFDLMIKRKVLNPLTRPERLRLMETGLRDRSELVRASAFELLRVWLGLSNRDPVALLRRFDVENGVQATDISSLTVEIIKQLLFSDNDLTVTEQEAHVMQDNMEAIRQLKLKITNFDIKINEIKESINQFVTAHQFNDLNQLINELKSMEEQRKLLEMQKQQMIDANNPVTNI